MRIAMCDDEKKFLDELKGLIAKSYPDTEKLCINEFDSGEKFLSQFKANQFDVIILDIEMKKLTGLQVAEKIRETDKSVIIAFLTSHQEFATSGYEVNAFRYLLKGQPEHMYIKQLRSIFNEYHQTHMTFPVQTSNTVFNISVSDILYFEIFKRTVVLHTRTDKYQFTLIASNEICSICDTSNKLGDGNYYYVASGVENCVDATKYMTYYIVTRWFGEEKYVALGNDRSGLLGFFGYNKLVDKYGSSSVSNAEMHAEELSDMIEKYNKVFGES